MERMTLPNRISLVEVLNKKSSPTDSSDKDWVWFVYDHDYLLEETCEVRTLDYDEQEMYRFRLLEYLVDNGINHNLMWIILHLNDLNSEQDFNRLPVIKIPSEGVVSRLYSSYMSQKTKQQSEFKK